MTEQKSLTTAEREWLWTLIVDGLYRGPRPPLGWSRARDGSILKQLAKHYTADDIAAAIQGVRLVFKTDAPLTLKAIYAQGKGVRPLFGLAMDAWHKSQEAKPAPVVRGQGRAPSAIADVLRGLVP